MEDSLLRPMESFSSISTLAAGGEGMHFLVSLLVFGVALHSCQVNIHQAEDDPRHYHGAILANQLKVLLVSDPTATQAAATLVVSSGSQDDPAHLQGMAHFCEHMVHLGSKAYPSENDFHHLLTSNGGERHAFTHYNHTLYGFYVNPGALAKSLDVFAHMFTDPLMRASNVASEVLNVDSEFNLRSSDLNNKLFAASDRVANHTHPYTQFQLGNLKSLATEAETHGLCLHEEVKRYFDTYYSASIMQLVVIAPAPLAELKAMVAPFAHIPNNNRRATNAGSPFLAEHLGVDIRINPNTAEYGIQFEFILPSLGQDSFFEYLASYLNRKDNGSFLQAQKRKRHIRDISAGISESYTSFTKFKIDVVPVSSTLEHADAITQDLFSYLQLLKAEAIDQARYAEFNKEKPTLDDFTPSDLADALALQIHTESQLQDVAVSLVKQEPFDAAKLAQVLEMLSPATMRRILYSPAISASQKDSWYDYTYATSPTSQDLVDELYSATAPPDMHLPKSKAVVAKVATEEAPTNLKLAKSTPRARLWHVGGSDTETNILGLTITSTNPPSKEELLKLQLLLLVLAEETSALRGEAEHRSEALGFENYKNKLVIKVVSSDIHHYLRPALDAVKDLVVSAEEFDDKKALLLSGFDLFGAQPAANQALALLNAALGWGGLPNDELKRMLNRLGVDELREWFRSFVGCSRIDALLVGREDSSPVFEIIKGFQAHLNCCHHRSQSNKIAFAGENFYQQPPARQGSASAIAFYVDLYNYDNEENIALTLMIASFADTKFFDQLRTKESLGYSLGAKHLSKAGGGGLLMYIQSEKHPVLLESRIEAFLKDFVEGMERLPATEFATTKQGLLDDRNQDRPDLANIFAKYWGNVLSGELDFELGNLPPNPSNSVAAKVTTALEAVTQQQLVDFMKVALLRSGLRKKLSIHMLPSNHEALATPADFTFVECGSLIPDLQKWKEEILGF